MPRRDGISQDGTGSSSYSLGSGDQLQVVVFRHPDLSDRFLLDGEGYLALPLVGEIAASHLTTRQLEVEIESRLKAGGFLVSPQVGVQLVT
jgi:polysaccharide export outer membrane protein